MKFSNLKIIVAIVPFLFVVGCAKYKPHTLRIPFVGAAHEKHTTPKNRLVEMRAKALAEADCSYYFSRRIINKGYQPIQLYVKNSSSRTYVLNTTDLNLQLESSYSVARKLHLNDVQRFVGWAIPGLFIWPFFIPALVELVRVPDANKALDNDFEQRVLGAGDSIVLRPNSCLNKVMFIRSENYLPELQVKLVDRDSSEILSFSLKI